MPIISRVALNTSHDRLEGLLRKRLEPGADKAAIDRHIWDLFGSTWAVMFTDLSGFSRNVAHFGIIQFLQTIVESQRLFTPVLEEHDGFLLKTEGDSMLVIFRNPERALDCALAMQRTAAAYNEGRDPAEKVLLCVGLGYGRVLRIADEDVYGSEVNAASKLGEDMARAGEVLVTEAMRKALKKRGGLRFVKTAKAPSGAKAAYRVAAA
ncbi:MAG: adenylate/guanylate cyclase domain-containing protein [Elusimicrobia bacterium]|nr:adenylate/guanylate cyclase domain-containing protein [Elusimicrobiota bacterium]